MMDATDQSSTPLPEMQELNTPQEAAAVVIASTGPERDNTSCTVAPAVPLQQVVGPVGLAADDSVGSIDGPQTANSAGQSPISVPTTQNGTDGKEKEAVLKEQSPGTQVPPGFKLDRRYREGSGKAYIVFEGSCTCGMKRT